MVFGPAGELMNRLMADWDAVEAAMFSQRKKKTGEKREQKKAVGKKFDLLRPFIHSMVVQIQQT